MNSDPVSKASPSPQFRGRPAVVIGVLMALGVIGVRLAGGLPFQRRNEVTLGILGVGLLALTVWWIAFSRTSRTLRWGLLAGGLAGLAGLAATFRVRGFSGDLLPILEPRWSRPAWMTLHSAPSPTTPPPTPATARPAFPQFLGPHRTGVLDGPALHADWAKHPPVVLWRQPIGVAWSGFSIVGDRAITQEQRGEEELVTCYDLLTGRSLWTHADAAHFQRTLGGEGPRATPTISGNRVYALGATGWLNCLDLATGRKVWARHLVQENAGRIPEWGYAGSPLVWQDKVIVESGGDDEQSLLALDPDTGAIRWGGGTARPDYGSPFPATLAGVEQIVLFNHGRVSAHDVRNGRVLWEMRWGGGHPLVANPIVVSSNEVVLSSGYGVGSKRLALKPKPDGTLTPEVVWSSIRMKAKFANPVARDGFLYGLDDGVLACLDLKDGSQRWKEGRHGHGQGLLVRDLLLLMSEAGELLLLRPTPEAPHELGRFPVFSAKTWNPLALSGDLLLVRNDQEVACLRLKLAE